MKNALKFQSIAMLLLLSLVVTQFALAQNVIPAPPSVGGYSNKITKSISIPIMFLAPLENKNNIAPTLPSMAVFNETVWNGNNWSNGFPNYNTRAVLNKSYTTSSILEAQDVVIKDNVILTLNAGAMLKIKQILSPVTKTKIVMNEGSGLLSKSSNLASPNFILTRPSGPTNQYSSMYISSPVSGQTIGNTYTNPLNSYDVSHAYQQVTYVSNAYVNLAETAIMNPGQGYIETINGNGQFDQPLTFADDYNQEYNGTENTASSYSMSINTGFNLLGNPYASYLDADSFLLDTSNTTISTIYLWTRNTLASVAVPGSGIFNFSTNDYAMYNVLGGINAGRNITNSNGPNARNNLNIPDGKIAFGTGFFIRGTGSGTATFRNTMLTTGSQVFKGGSKITNTALITPPTRSRIWVNLSEGLGYDPVNGKFRQALVGYAAGATAAANDRLFDAATFSDASFNPTIDIYSFAPSSTVHLAIQGRDNFLNTDAFPLGYKTSGGTFTFSTTHDGIFNTQGYYILDANDGSYHTLPYTFTTSAGTFDTRFTIVFEHLTGVVSDPLICGTTLANSSTTIYSLQVTGATTYIFEVTKDNPPGTGTFIGEYTGNAGAIHKFNLNFSPILYNTNYYIRVATYQINGVWAYGPVCMVRTPSPPTTGMVYPTPCGGTITNSWTSIYAGQVNGIYGISATQYRFHVTCSSNGITYQYDAPTSPLSSTCNLHKFGTMPILPNTTYTFTVDVFWDGAWRIGTDQCIITTGSPITKQLLTGEDSFEVEASPNPFANNFSIDLNSSVKDVAVISVYDMLGRLMESRKVIPSEVASKQMGDEYHSGVYTIVIKQGENIKTLRVIKR